MQYKSILTILKTLTDKLNWPMEEGRNRKHKRAVWQKAALTPSREGIKAQSGKWARSFYNYTAIKKHMQQWRSKFKSEPWETPLVSLLGRGSETTELTEKVWFKEAQYKHHIVYVWTSPSYLKTNHHTHHRNHLTRRWIVKISTGSPVPAFSHRPNVPTPALSQCAVHNHNPSNQSQGNRGDTTKWF